MQVDTPDAGALAAALRDSGLGEVDGETAVRLSITRLHAGCLAVDGRGPDWEQRWSAMIRFAAEHGWVDEEADWLRAHVVSACPGQP